MRIRRDHFTLWLEPGLETDWIEHVLASLPPGPKRGYVNVPLPASLSPGEAMVKVYNRRPKHTVLRRLRRGKSVREARGMRVFAGAGLPVVRLLGWGEERTFGLWQRGVIITERVHAVTLADAYADAPEPEVFDGGIEQLARIHRAGLSHGDARAGNFMIAGDDVVIIDVEAWSRINPGSRSRDLVRYLGSVIAATGDPGAAESLLDRYEQLAGGSTDSREALLARAAAYAPVATALEETRT